MTTQLVNNSISIRPGVSILSVLSHLNYKPWFAIAEFVDNSLQSAIDYKPALIEADGNNYKLVVSIDLDPSDGGRITIRDNAAGIHDADYPRAFRPAAIPPNRSGLSEFGMGMKSAACWFAHRWTVRTSALGEPVERSIHFDIDKIVRDDIEELTIDTVAAEPGYHFTEIILYDLNKIPQGNTIKKIREHLASIYRVFIRNGSLVLEFDGDPLSYPEPSILRAPHFKDLSGEPKLWRKEIDFDFGDGLEVHGFAALRETGSVSGAGFALFRNSRLIQGSADEGYRPEFIFKKSNSYTYQRLFGELHLTGFEVSHTKDGFRWEDYEEPFLELLKEHLDSEPLPLLEQAEGHRVRANTEELKKAATTAANRTAATVEREIPQPFGTQLRSLPDKSNPPDELPKASAASIRIIDIEVNGDSWQIILELSDYPAIGEWIEICDHLVNKVPISGNPQRRVGIRMSLIHPFMERFAGSDPAIIEPLLRVGVALVLGEIAARKSGVQMAGTIRRNVNKLLRDALSKP